MDFTSDESVLFYNGESSLNQKIMDHNGFLMLAFSDILLK